MLLLAVLVHVSGVLERKESYVKYGPFLEAKEEFDVLFIGNSHMVNGVFPMELWRDYGIVSYNIAGYGNTVPVSYWAMRNAFDYHKPKLMVIDILDVGKKSKLTGSSGDLHKALDCYPLSLTKIQAIQDLIDDPYATDDDGNYFVDMKWEYFLPLGKYHSRWNVLTESDFQPEMTKQKGAEAVIGVAQPRDYEIFEDGYAAEEDGWGFAYLRKMIEECKAQGIDVLLTYLPHPSTQEQQREANAVRWIAEEYGVNFVDLVYMDQVVDYSTDLFDSFSHLNPSGAKKVTDFLGRYIMDHYDISDRRIDPEYKDWEQDYSAYEAHKARYIAGQGKLENLLSLLHDKSFHVNLYVVEGSAVYNHDKLMLLMHNAAREHVFEEDEFVKYSSSMFPLDSLDEAAASGCAYYAHLNGPGEPAEEYTGEEAVLLAQEHFGQIPEGAQVVIEVLYADTGETAAVMHF